MTSSRSSGAKTTLRTIPRTSRVRVTGARLSRARLARPATISSSTRDSRPPRTALARMTAPPVPWRTRAVSEATRWLEKVPR